MSAEDPSTVAHLADLVAAAAARHPDHPAVVARCGAGASPPRSGPPSTSADAVPADRGRRHPGPRATLAGDRTSPEGEAPTERSEGVR